MVIIRRFPKIQHLYDVAKDISNSLAKVAVAGKINGQLRDLSVIIEKNCDIEIVKKNDEEGLILLDTLLLILWVMPLNNFIQKLKWQSGLL